MKTSKRKKVESAGWKVGDAANFLELSREEAVFLEIRSSLANYLRKSRKERRITQTQLAKALRSSQSRVAKMESGDPSVSLDLLIRSLLHLGKSSKEVGEVIGLEAI